MSKTPDLGLAAALMSLGHSCEIEKGMTELQKVFVFTIAQETMDELFLQYRHNGLPVDAYSHAQHLKILKRRLYHP